MQTHTSDPPERFQDFSHVLGLCYSSVSFWGSRFLDWETSDFSSSLTDGRPQSDYPASDHVSQPHKSPLRILQTFICPVPLRTLTQLGLEEGWHFKHFEGVGICLRTRLWDVHIFSVDTWQVTTDLVPYTIHSAGKKPYLMEGVFFCSGPSKAKSRHLLGVLLSRTQGPLPRSLNCDSSVSCNCRAKVFIFFLLVQLFETTCIPYLVAPSIFIATDNFPDIESPSLFFSPFWDYRWPTLSQL